MRDCEAAHAIVQPEQTTDRYGKHYYNM